ncbi:transcription factor IIIA [Galendromus occidentalis]|uniref:Transcription factor IIIA n=1 Tax=Galendromus occidentalis TaxID=34638 RepID=A0AAJ6QQZ8_9ACAR|nr:transcription factor IIIA [Galendromus occidentalis]
MDLATKNSLSLIFDEKFEDTRKYVCDAPGCGKTFVKNNFLEFHIRTHTNERPFHCSFPGCSLSYTRSWHLRRHVINAHQPKPEVVAKFECQESGCSRVYQSKDALRKHHAEIHGSNGRLAGPRYQCSVCHLSFSKHNKLKVHASLHSGEMPFKCSVEGCGREYRIHSKLKAHEKSHLGYACESCDNQRFPTWSALRKHSAETHSAKRCPKCDKTFKQNALLMAHMETHSDNRLAFVCPFPECEKSYFEMKNLRAHQKAAHENVRFTCTECQKEFCSKQTLRRHGRKCMNKTYERKAPKTGDLRKTRVDKGKPRRRAAVFLSAVDSKDIDHPEE